MSKLTSTKLQLFDILNKQSNTFIRTPEPTELCALDSMYILADWLYYAYLNHMVSQEIFIYIYIYMYQLMSTLYLV